MIGHTLIHGNGGVSFGSGSGDQSSGAQPPAAPPDHAAWEAARDAFIKAEARMNKYADKIADLRDEISEDMIYIERAEEQITTVETQIATLNGKIIATNGKIANNNTRMNAIQNDLNRWILKADAAVTAIDQAHVRIREAHDVIRQAAVPDNATLGETIIAQGTIIEAQNRIIFDNEAAERLARAEMAKLGASIQNGQRATATLEISNQVSERTIMDGRGHIVDLQHYINTTREKIAELDVDMHGWGPKYIQVWDAYNHAREAMNALDAFRGASSPEIDQEWNQEPYFEIHPHDIETPESDPNLPPLPPGYRPSGHGASHTTTTSGPSIPDATMHASTASALIDFHNLDRVAATESAALEHSTNVDGTPPQVLVVIGVAEHGVIG